MPGEIHFLFDRAGKPAWAEMLDHPDWEWIEDVTKETSDGWDLHENFDGSTFAKERYADLDQVSRVNAIGNHFGGKNLASGKLHGRYGFYGLYVRKTALAEKGPLPDAPVE